MLKDNIKVKTSLGEYKDFPYKKELYIYGKCVWTDDFQTNVGDAVCVNLFIQELQEVLSGMTYEYKSEEHV